MLSWDTEVASITECIHSFSTCKKCIQSSFMRILSLWCDRAERGSAIIEVIIVVEVGRGFLFLKGGKGWFGRCGGGSSERLGKWVIRTRGCWLNCLGLLIVGSPRVIRVGWDKWFRLLLLLRLESTRALSIGVIAG